MKTALLLLLPVLASAQQKIAAAVWQFTVGSYTAQVTIVQTSATQFVGSFCCAGVSAFRGQLAAVGNATAVTINWDPGLLSRTDSFANVPGLAAGATYTGFLGFNGCSLAGSYGNVATPQMGTWSAAVTPGSYQSAFPPCNSTIGSAPGCSNSTLTSGYGYSFSGFMVDTSLYPIAMTGRMLFDGSGGFTANNSASLNGVLSSGPLQGTYTVNPDCTAMLTFTDNRGVTEAQVQGVISSAGKTIQLIHMGTGMVVTGTAYQQ